MGIRIFGMAEEHWEDVARIYQLGLETGIATFEAGVPSREQFFNAKIGMLSSVAVAADGRIAGWVAAGLVSERAAYRGVIEHSLYVDSARSGQGTGSLLLAELIRRAGEQGYWMIQSSIIDANQPSRRLHLKAGFREVGRRERIAQGTRGEVAGQWLDTYLYELRL